MNSHQRLHIATRDARRQLHGGTHAENARRILRLMRQPDFRGIHPRHLVIVLPHIVRAEAEAAKSAAWDLNLDGKNVEVDKTWRTLMQKADVLFGWATQCTFESTQRDALTALDRLISQLEKVA